MKKRNYTILACTIASVFWFSDASIHFWIYKEPDFEIVPDDFNELWMRAIIVVLVILFGVYADFSTRKLLVQEKQLEATRIYNSMIYATQHILNNLLNQMQLFKLEALKSSDFDPDFIKYYDNAIEEATDLVQRLSQVTNITDENIWASVDPVNIAKSSNSNKNAVEESSEAEMQGREKVG